MLDPPLRPPPPTSPCKLKTGEDVPCIDVDEMPVGSNIQTGTYWSRLWCGHGCGVGGIPGYGNDINNFRGTKIEFSLTTKRANTLVYVQGQLSMSPQTTSHNYVDIWRSINGGPYKRSVLRRT